MIICWSRRGQAAGSGARRLSQALAGELDAIGVVNDAIEDGIGERRIADDLVPAVDRQLAGDDDGAGVVAVLDDLRAGRGAARRSAARVPNRRG